MLVPDGSVDLLVPAVEYRHGWQLRWKLIEVAATVMVRDDSNYVPLLAREARHRSAPRANVVPQIADAATAISPSKF
jgi:hypothetical protein